MAIPTLHQKSECKHIDGNVMVDSDALIHV